jgi:hypothetical protein
VDLLEAPEGLWGGGGGRVLLQESKALEVARASGGVTEEVSLRREEERGAAGGQQQRREDRGEELEVLSTEDVAQSLKSGATQILFLKATEEGPVGGVGRGEGGREENCRDWSGGEVKPLSPVGLREDIGVEETEEDESGGGQMQQSPQSCLPEKRSQESVEEGAIFLQRDDLLLLPLPLPLPLPLSLLSHCPSDAKELDVIPNLHSCDSDHSSSQKPMLMKPSLKSHHTTKSSGVPEKSSGDKKEEDGVLDHPNPRHKSSEINFKFVKIFNEPNTAPLFASFPC